MHLTCVVGARPNFMKIAPILSAAAATPRMNTVLIHTGQHYDARMSALFFEELRLPRPDVYLGVGSGTHAAQTARVMLAFDEAIDGLTTDVVVVVGDVNSTLACALVAVKRGIAVAHVEAGLRSRDRTMPEEINRILTDQIAQYLFTTEADAAANLLAEGIQPERIYFVGNVMIDTLLRHRERARGSEVLRRLALEPRGYAVSTLHRPSNVDTPQAAERTVRALELVADRLPVILPIHPRTEDKLDGFGLTGRVHGNPGIKVTEPLGYLDFLCLMDNARVVFTDSGGIQEETTVLGVPCLTYRENTERPITVSEGTNTLVGQDADRVEKALDSVLARDMPQHRTPDLWDGRAAERILAVLAQHGTN